MRKIAIILLIIALSMILSGILLWEYIDVKCDSVNKNTDFWVKNCDYK